MKCSVSAKHINIKSNYLAKIELKLLGNNAPTNSGVPVISRHSEFASNLRDRPKSMILSFLLSLPSKTKFSG